MTVPERNLLFHLVEMFENLQRRGIAIPDTEIITAHRYIREINDELLSGKGWGEMPK